MEKRALLIEFDATTGERAGGIDPNDPHLQCYAWQDLESEPAREIRVIEDDRDMSQYENVPGIAILNGKTEINQAITNVVPELYFIQDEPMLLEHVRQRNIKLDDYSGKKHQAVLQSLHEKGLVGIAKRSRRFL